jgi:hypothetical protein
VSLAHSAKHISRAASLDAVTSSDAAFASSCYLARRSLLVARNKSPKIIRRLLGSIAKHAAMLRITTISANGSPAIVKLEGKLLEPWISELQEACRAARKQDGAATLDLGGLSYIDNPGTIALRDLIRRGVAVTGCSPLVSELLKETER